MTHHPDLVDLLAQAIEVNAYSVALVVLPEIERVPTIEVEPTGLMSWQLGRAMHRVATLREHIEAGDLGAAYADCVDVLDQLERLHHRLTRAELPPERAAPRAERGAKTERQRFREGGITEVQKLARTSHKRHKPFVYQRRTPEQWQSTRRELDASGTIGRRAPWLADLLAAAIHHDALLSAFEAQLIEDLAQRFDRFGINMYLSERQRAVLVEIEARLADRGLW